MPCCGIKEKWGRPTGNLTGSSCTELLVIYKRLKHFSLAGFPPLWCFHPSVSCPDLCRRRSSDGAGLRCGASRGTWGCAGPSATSHSSCIGSLPRCGRACGGGAPVSGRTSGRTQCRKMVSLRCGSSGDTPDFLGDRQVVDSQTGRLGRELFSNNVRRWEASHYAVCLFVITQHAKRTSAEIGECDCLLFLLF